MRNKNLAGFPSAPKIELKLVQTPSELQRETQLLLSFISRFLGITAQSTLAFISSSSFRLTACVQRFLLHLCGSFP